MGIVFKTCHIHQMCKLLMVQNTQTALLDLWSHKRGGVSIDSIVKSLWTSVYGLGIFGETWYIHRMNEITVSSFPHKALSRKCQKGQHHKLEPRRWWKQNGIFKQKRKKSYQSSKQNKALCTLGFWWQPTSASLLYLYYSKIYSIISAPLTHFQHTSKCRPYLRIRGRT